MRSPSTIILLTREKFCLPGQCLDYCPPPFWNKLCTYHETDAFILDFNLVLETMIEKCSERAGSSVYMCKLCQKRMSNKTKIKRHAEIHLDPEPPADSEFLSLLRISEFTQNFWVFSFYIADFWQTFWVIWENGSNQIKFEAENEIFCTWMVEKLLAPNSDFYSEIQELTQILLRISEEKMVAEGSVERTLKLQILNSEAHSGSYFDLLKPS